MNADIAIRLENLSKVYRIGVNDQRHETMLGAVTSLLRAPVANYRSLRKLSHFNSTDQEDVIWALKDVSFEVKKGEAVGIIGSNGAGKSTLLKILSRITEPTRGQATVRGRVGSLLEIGTGFHPDLTGRENIYLNGTILSMRKREIDAKFDDIVAFSGVEKFIDTPVKRYSTGMRVRLGFSVAAHLDPEVLVIDEVLAVGDAAFQQRCLAKMGEATGYGRTVLFVSHNLAAVSTLCRTAFRLEGGRMVDQGDSRSVITHYVQDTHRAGNGSGYVDLRDHQRPDTLTNRHAQFDWVRTLDSRKVQKPSFVEGEPITVEVGFRTTKPGGYLQLGCGVRRCEDQVVLFTTPSPEYSAQLPPGHYVSRMEMRPNYLRQGMYSLFLKLFIDGVRQDTLGDVLRFSIMPCHPDGASNALAQRWVAGPFRLDFPWAEPRRSDDMALYDRQFSPVSPELLRP